MFNEESQTSKSFMYGQISIVVQSQTELLTVSVHVGALFGVTLSNHHSVIIYHQVLVIIQSLTS